jgi:hypothetical protein
MVRVEATAESGESPESSARYQPPGGGYDPTRPLVLPGGGFGASVASPRIPLVLVRVLNPKLFRPLPPSFHLSERVALRAPVRDHGVSSTPRATSEQQPQRYGRRIDAGRGVRRGPRATGCE